MNILKATRTFQLSPGESSIFTNGETRLREGLWRGTHNVRTETKCRFSGSPPTSQNFKEFSDNKQIKNWPQTLIIFIKIPHNFVLSDFLSHSLLFPLFIHLFLILHLCFLCLQFFFTPLNLSFKTQLCEFLWSKWKGGSLADWITGLNFSFPCDSISHLHSCYGLKVARMHALLHDLGMFTCHLHDVTYFCHYCEHMTWVSTASRAVGWDRKCKPDTDL